MMNEINDKKINSFTLEKNFQPENLKKNVVLFLPDIVAETEQQKDISVIQKEEYATIAQFNQESLADASKIQSIERNISNLKSVPALPQKQEMDNSKISKPLASEKITEYTSRLWKYIPIPDEEPESSPEYLFGEKNYPGSQVIGARVRGKKHKHEGTNCDDWYEVGSFENITFIAVSDGAGSKHFSRIGARVSCKAAIGYLIKSFATVFSKRRELFNEIRLSQTDPKCIEAYNILASTMQQSVIKAYEAVESAYYLRVIDPVFQQILQRELELNDLSATLLLTAIIPIGMDTKEHLIISCQVGDGMISILNTKGDFSSSLKLMGEPDSGDFSGETEFLTSAKMHTIEALQSRTKIFRGIVDLVMVMSDGVADDYFPNGTEMRRLYYDLIANGILFRKDLKPNLLGQSPQFNILPAPLAYPWTNDQSVKVPLYYTNQLCQAMGLSLKDLWKDPAVLELAQAQLNKQMKAVSSSEQLKIWLDNYVERGSFDDRTLVIAQM